MTFAKSRVNSGRNRRILLPNMAPFAGVIFLTVCFYAITTRFKTPALGNVAIEELPHRNGSSCVHLPENSESVIGLDTAGHYSFYVDGPLFQTATIQKVAATYGIVFSASQLSTLSQIEYLDADIRELPAILERPAYQRRFRFAGKQIPLGEEQLLACVITSRSVIQSLIHKPCYVALLINSETTASKVMHLIDVLQARGINRFILKIQDGQQNASLHW